VLDAIFFEKRGIPASVIITERSCRPPPDRRARGYARLSARGHPHPVGSLSTAEVRQRADAAVTAVEVLLLRAEAG